jgi:hypothetical protein
MRMAFSALPPEQAILTVSATMEVAAFHSQSSNVASLWTSWEAEYGKSREVYQTVFDPLQICCRTQVLAKQK